MGADKKRIIIIDDDPNNIREIKDMLEPKGYSVFFASDGPSGIEKIKNLKPDLLLLDLVLPGQSGFKIAQEIRALPEAKYIPIIAISLKREDIDKHIAAHSGIADYVEKPIDYQRLFYIIKDIIGE
ncbi:MAG: response regulator [Candidatus Omnitrophota bacterium]